MMDINATKGDRTYELSPTNTKDEILSGWLLLLK